jgi:cell division protein FtsQ
MSRFGRASHRLARRRTGARWRIPRVARVAAWLLAIGMAAAAATHMWRAGLPPAANDFLVDAGDRVLVASAKLGLSVKDVFVEGRGETAPADILAAIGIRHGAPIMAFDPHRAKGELERLAWIRHADVERRLPDTIYIRVVERVPLALWQNHGRMALIDRAGVEIRGVDVRRFSYLPQVVGPDAPLHAAQLVALLETEPDIAARITAAIRVGGRRWNLKLDNGIDVRLPETNFGAAWVRLAELVRKDGLLERDVTVVDLRLPDRLILRTVREVAPPPPKGARGAGRPT